MKGFIRILEAIIASIILLTALSFFFKPQIISTGWDSILLKTTANDIVASLYFNGSMSKFVFENDDKGMNEYFGNALPKTTGYSVSVYNIPSHNIYIGTLSNDDEIMLRSVIGNEIKYRDRQIFLYVKNMTMADIDPKTKIIFIYGYTNLNPYKTTINNFLDRGGTIILISSLAQNQVNDGILNETFGLAWGGSGSGSGNLYNGDITKAASYKISNYFQNISSFSKSTSFDFDGASSIQVDEKTVIKSSFGSNSYVKINEHVTRYGNGKTVWMADYTSRNEENELLKALILWGSEDFKMDLYDKKIPDEYTKVFYAGGGAEPFLFELTIWNIF